MHTGLFHAMFDLDLPILEKIIRPIIVYVALILGLRLAGKRELAQLNPFDLVVLLTISNTVQNAIIGNDNSISGGLIGMATLLVINYFVVRLTSRHRTIDRLIEGDSTLLIRHGKLLRDRLDHELLTVTELETAARKQGFNSIDEIEHATLEPGGTISFVPKDPNPTELRYREILARLERIEVRLQSPS